MRRTKLEVEVQYDPSLTDPEGLASAFDRLMEAVLSTPGIMEEYGDPRIGEFFVAPSDQKDGVVEVKHWVLYDMDAGSLLTTTVYDTYAEAVEDASDPRLHDILVLPLTWEEHEMVPTEEPANHPSE
jgi:hypothetical protein